MSSIKVLYEDNHLIAVFKPAGVLVQGNISLMDEVKKYLKEKYKKQGNVFLGLIHRLDRPVSGIVLYAKTSKGASRISEQFRNRTIEKTYNALVVGKPEREKGTLINYLKKDENRKISVVGKEGESGYDRAELEYRIIKTNEKYSLLEIKIKTGRFHQIRAQMSEMGCPILGDVKYGAKSLLPDKSIALCAVSLSFQLAVKKEIKKISIEYPKEWEKYLN